MLISVNNLKCSLDENDDELIYKAAKKLGIEKNYLQNFSITKESIDARNKNNIHFVYTIKTEIPDDYTIRDDNDIKAIKEENVVLSPGNAPLNYNPVIIGSGPAGLFAALTLSEYGYKPILLERGDCVENRTICVEKYWKTGVIDTESNVQFGEGGAGTFSDGKLTTRINDPRCDKVLTEFEKSGISRLVLSKAKPHIGTDKLKKVLVNIRERIMSNGGEIRFRSKVTGFNIKDGKLFGVIVNNSEIINTEVVILSIGHSARDTFEELNRLGVYMEQKPFSVGVRIEHKQEMINHIQFGKYANHPRLGSAEYQLFHKFKERTVYSFCMCPGGSVVAAASEKDTIVTNGMSEYARNMENANSALVVSVNPADYGTNHPLSGMYFQRELEKKAFIIGGSKNAAPVQKLSDFLKNSVSSKAGSIKPGYTGEIKFADINLCLPSIITNPMKESISFLDHSLPGFATPDAILTGVETRTSSPIRIKRDDETYQSVSTKGLYPTGEGAGYAGGIMSAAVDGIRVAEKIITQYKPL